MWKIIIIVFIGLVIFGGLMSAVEYLKEHSLFLAAGLIVVFFFFFSGWKTALEALLLIIVGTVVCNTLIHICYRMFRNVRETNNEKKLKDYLELNCKNLGYMDEEKWRASLPKFADLPYKSSFFTITASFARAQEKLFFSEEKLREQYEICYQLLKERKGGFIIESMLPGLKLFLRPTHTSKDIDIIDRLTEQICREDERLERNKLKNGQILLTWEGKSNAGDNVSEDSGSCDGQQAGIETEYISVEELLG